MTGQIFTPCVMVVILGSVSLFADGPPLSCCLRLRDRRPHLDKILTYRIQTEEMCPIRAVLFQTVAGKMLCSDPESSWTKSAMWKVDEDQRKLREQNAEAVESFSGGTQRKRRSSDNSRNATKQRSYNNNVDE